jgi:KGK domain
MSDRFNPLDSGEVISIQKDSQVLVGHRIFRVSELNDAIANHLKNAVDTWTDDKSNWFNTQGIDCEALRFGSNAWQKGKIRLCLEFCPDDATTSAPNQAAIGTPVVTPATNHTPSHAPAAVTPAPALHANPNIAVATTDTPAVEAKINPAAGVAAVGAGVAVMAASAAAVNNVVIPNVAKVMAPTGAMATPAISDVILESAQKPDVDASKQDGLDEIAFDFDTSNDNLGTMIPNGMMELDLTDLDLERAENDYLDFETGGIPDPTLELNSPHSMGKSENSGMLIDEVWNELSQPNWPGIH